VRDSYKCGNLEFGALGSLAAGSTLMRPWMADLLNRVSRRTAITGAGTYLSSRAASGREQFSDIRYSNRRREI
jgi:hypothetical protein